MVCMLDDWPLRTVTWSEDCHHLYVGFNHEFTGLHLLTPGGQHLIG